MATTINTFSVGLTLDAADYINKSTLAGNETRRLSRAIEEARTPMEKFTLSQSRLDKALEKGGIDRATYNRLLDASKTKLEAATKSVVAQGNAMTDMTGRLKSLVAGYVGLQTVTKSIKLAIEAEQAAAAFEVLTGSVNNATVLLGQIRTLSDVSPLSFGGVQMAAKTLLGFGVPVEKVIGSLGMLSDVSAGNEERFRSLALVYAQTASAGKLIGSDLLQYVAAGFNPLQEIAKKTGESMMELRDRMSEGAISAEEVEQAFITATGEGGKFNGMTDKLADTMGGRLAIAMANVEKAGISLGQTFEPIISSLTEGFSKGTSAIQVFTGFVEKWLDGVGMVGNYVVDVVEFIAAAVSGANVGDFKPDKMDAWLDRLEKRDKDRADKLFTEAMNRTIGGGKFDVGVAKDAVVSRVGTEDFAEKVKVENERLTKSADDRHKKMLDAMDKSDDEFSKAQDGLSDRLNDFRREQKIADDAFTMDVEEALQNAMKHFDDERKKDENLRSDLSKGVGGDFEVGSQQAFNAWAEGINKSIGIDAVPDRPTPGEDEIKEEVAKQYAELQKLNAAQAEQLAQLREVVIAVKENGFKRLR